MTRKELVSAFNKNVFIASCSTAYSIVPGAGLAIRLINHDAFALPEITLGCILGLMVGVSAATSHSLQAVGIAFRLSGLNTAGYNAEPETTRPQVEASRPIQESIFARHLGDNSRTMG